ncbi:type IV secretion system protein [Shinella kummerowiae]|uniref:type IV secretion system protein n=1 Tax=Shinella kummerowiae TaxID=417745 RepID=UPI0021B52D37|nr:type IV secretion system protein [Shinella kummerowiae]MCT7667477.1 type IV secretion system protein [Shinella kummerowiae]
MVFISWLHELITNIMLEYLQTVFEYVADPLAVLLKAVALIALLFIALNHIMQFKPVNYSIYLWWGVRYVLISSFAFVWGNFKGIYTLITETPGDYGALMTQAVVVKYATYRPDILDPTKVTDQYKGMDALGGTLFWMARDFFRDTSIWDLGMTFKNIGLGILFGILGAIWTGVSAIIVMIADIGFMMALSLAPLAICMLMMEQTRQYFEAWSRFVLSFLVIPLLLSALVSIMLYAACELLLVTKAGSQNKEAYLLFAVVTVAGFVLLWKLPEMGQAISGSAVGAAGVGLARMATSSGMRSPGNAARMAFRGAQRIRDGAQVANAARKAGASPGRIMWSTLNGMRQSAIARQNRRDDRLSGRTRGLGGSGGGGGGSGDGGSSSSPQSPLPSPGSRVGLAGRVLRDGFRAAMAVREAGGSRGKMLRAALGGMGKSASVRRARRTEILEARKARAAESGGRAPRRKNSRGTSPEDYEN